METNHEDYIMYLGKSNRNSYRYGRLTWNSRGELEIKTTMILANNCFGSKVIGSIYNCNFIGEDEISYNKNSIRLFGHKLSEKTLKQINEFTVEENIRKINDKASKSFNKMVDFESYTISELKIQYRKMSTLERTALIAKIINHITSI